MNDENFKAMYIHDLASFFHCSFNILHPHASFQDNWHINLMASYLKQVSDGQIKRLIINLPPRMLKSECVSIAWAAWELGRNPRKKILCLHASKALGGDLDEACSELMTSRRYRWLFPSTVIKPGKDRITTSFKGHRQFMPINGRLTGLGADTVIIDDPMSTADARDAHERQRLNEQFDDNIVQRLNDKSNGAIVLVMQRLHEDDLTSHLLAKNEGWVHLNLPAIALHDEVWQLPYGRQYTRKKGEVLHEARESREELYNTLISVGGHAFAYQYLQGAYKPQFGKEGHGSLWLTPQRQGQFWDARIDVKRPHGFHHFKESDLILPRVFGVGEDPAPANMRQMLTTEEWAISANICRDEMLERERQIASGEIEY
jgi:hypothetical protein